MKKTFILFLGLLSIGLSIFAKSASGNSDGTLKWSYEIAGSISLGGVAISPSGNIYAGDSEGFVYAISPSGTLVWQRFLALENRLPENRVGGIPVSLLEALPANLELSHVPDSIWFPLDLFESDDFSNSSPVLTLDGKTVYVCGRLSGKIYALNATDGSINWAFNAREVQEVKDDSVHYGGGFVSSPAIAADGTIYVGSGDWWGDQWVEARNLGIDVDKVTQRKMSDKRLYAINPDGTLKWIWAVEPTDTHRTSLFASPAVGSDGTVYIGSFNGIFYALRDDGNRATELWKYEAKITQSPDNTNYQEFWSSPAIGVEGTVYVGNNDNYVYAFNQDGHLKWKYQTGSEVFVSPILGGDGTIYVPSEDTVFYALNPDGRLKWSSTVAEGGEIPDVAAITEDDTLIFGFGGSNRVVALEAKNGRLKWQTIVSGEKDEVGTSVAPAIGSDGTVYVYGGNSIHAINGSSPLSTKSFWPKFRKDLYNSGKMANLVPDIKINNLDGPFTLDTADSYTITLSLAAGNSSYDADWWFVWLTPANQLYHYDLSGTWIAGLNVSYQGRLLHLPVTTMPFPVELTAGTHSIYFGVDLNLNGEVNDNSLYYDTIHVVR